MKIRDGDRLVTLNEQDVTRLQSEHVHSVIIESKAPVTYQVVWHPELYIDFGEFCAT